MESLPIPMPPAGAPAYFSYITFGLAVLAFLASAVPFVVKLLSERANAEREDAKLHAGVKREFRVEDRTDFQIVRDELWGIIQDLKKELEAERAARKREQEECRTQIEALRKRIEVLEGRGPSAA